MSTDEIRSAPDDDDLEGHYSDVSARSRESVLRDASSTPVPAPIIAPPLERGTATPSASQRAEWETPFQVRGVRSWATPSTKRLPLRDVLILGPNLIEVRSLAGRPCRYTSNEVREVARVSHRVLRLVHRTCLKISFTMPGAPPLFFRPWRFRGVERAVTIAGWSVAPEYPPRGRGTVRRLLAAARRELRRLT